MGHRCFRSKLSTPKSLKLCNRKEIMTGSNGIRKLTEEQRKIAEEKRQKIRDQVSKRMGEMLLCGHTMLDAYCDVCTGILMEDRRGNQECVQCEILRTELQNSAGSGDVHVTEIPLNPNDDIDDTLGSDDEEVVTEQQVAGPLKQTSSADVDDSFKKILDLKQQCLKEVLHSKGIVGKDVEKEHSMHQHLTPDDKVEVKAKHKIKEKVHGLHQSLVLSEGKLDGKKKFKKHNAISAGTSYDGVQKAAEVVNDKLQWCTNLLLKTDNLDRICQLQTIIKGCIEILQMCKNFGCDM